MTTLALPKDVISVHATRNYTVPHAMPGHFSWLGQLNWGHGMIGKVTVAAAGARLDAVFPKLLDRLDRATGEGFSICDKATHRTVRLAFDSQT
jgi:hypothetical protein